MEQRHLIEAATFDLALERGLQGAFDETVVDGKLGRIVKAELLPVIEQVLDEIGAGGENLRIGRLEVDFDTVALDGSWTQARASLEAALRTALVGTQSGAAQARARAESRSRTVAQAEVPSPAKPVSDVPSFRGYALYEALRGRLAGEGAAGGEGVESLDVEQLVAALLAEHPRQLQRLYRELQSAAVLVGPALSSLSGAGLRALVRGFLSLTTPGADAAPSQFEQAIEAFAARSGSARRYYGEVLAHLVKGELVDLEAIAAGVEPEPEAPTVPQVAASGPAPRAAEAAPEMTADAALALGEALARYLGAGTLAPGVEAGSLAHAVAGMLAHAPAALRRRLEAALVDEASVGRLVELLPEPVLARVLFALAPGAYAALQGAADTLANAAHGPESGIAGARVAPLKWRFAIAHALRGGGQGPGGEFDEAAFVRGFTRELARESTLDDAAALAEALARQLALDVLPDARETQLRVLQALRAAAATVEDPGAPAVTDAAVSGPAARIREEGDGARAAPARETAGEPSFRGYALYEALRGRLAGEGAAGGEGVESLDVEQLVAALLAEHPRQLQRLYRELQSAAVPVGPALSGAGLRALVRGFLSLTTPGEGAAPSQFEQAIETFAVRAGSARRYYGEVLAHLVKGELVDLEAIAAGVEPEPEAPTVPRVAASGPAPRAAEAAPEMTADAALAHAVEGMLAHAPADLRRRLEAALVDEASVGRLVELLPEPVLARVLFALAPGAYAALQGTADTLANAAHGPESGIAGPRVAHLKWRFAIAHALRGGGQGPGGEFDEAAFVRGFTRELARESTLDDAAALAEALARQLALDVLPDARETQLRVLQALRAAAATVEDPGAPAVTDAETRDGVEGRFAQTPGESLRIVNAGLVLASPYLPLLFERLALTEGRAFRSRDAAERATWVLQFLVDGSIEPPEERSLVLNRLLCGLSGPSSPRARGRLRPEEQEAVESLLEAMIEHWAIIGKTTVAGLRESFLQRGGTLLRAADSWRLTVDPMPYDMLLDRLPWSFSMIKHPWMERLLQVAWR